MRSLLVGVGLLVFAPDSYAQDPERWDLSLGYTFLAERDRESPPRQDDRRSYHGWRVSGGRYVTSRLAVSGDVAGAYDQQRSGNSTIDLSVYSALVGIHVAALRRTRFSIFADALTGVVQLGARNRSYTETRHYGALQADFGLHLYPWQDVGFRVSIGYRHFLDSHQLLLESGLVLRFGA
jgi:hypothetical protein